MGSRTATGSGPVPPPAIAVIPQAKPAADWLAAERDRRKRGSPSGRAGGDPGRNQTAIAVFRMNTFEEW